MKRKAAGLSLLLVGIYVGGYLCLSLKGVYMPFTYGLNGIKSWIWTPSGFTNASGHLRREMFITFYPLLWMDARYWHNDWTGLTGPTRMPIPTTNPVASPAVDNAPTPVKQ